MLLLILATVSIAGTDAFVFSVSLTEIYSSVDRLVMNKTTCPITFRLRRPYKISTEVQRVLEDAFKTRKLFSSIFSKFGRGPQ